MQSAEDFRASIKDRYGFATWPKTRPAPAPQTRRAFVPRPDDLGAFVLERRRALPDHRNAYIDFYRRRDDALVQFSVTIIEHQTPEEAHENLVDFLTTVMAPRLPAIRDKGIDAGDVGLAGEEEVQRDVVFVTGAVFVRVQSIGEKDASVKELAELLDRHIRAHFA
jgi:hypothetical protein